VSIIMEYNKERNIFRVNLLAITFSLLISGCGLTGNFIDWKGNRELNEYAAQRKKLLLELKKYIGKGAEDIREIFGEPLKITHSTWFNGVHYEEGWDYKYHRGIFLIYSEGHLARFFFNNKKVFEVDIF